MRRRGVCPQTGESNPAPQKFDIEREKADNMFKDGHGT